MRPLFELPDVIRMAPLLHTINSDDIHRMIDPGTWLMANGDIVYVPRAIAVQVLGEVAQPGLYRMKAGSRLSDALALAGGLRDDADGTRIVITSRTSPTAMTKDNTVYDTWQCKHKCLRNQLCAHHRYHRCVMGSNLSDNIPLTDQDTVFVPKLNREVVVVGEVARPRTLQASERRKTNGRFGIGRRAH